MSDTVIAQIISGVITITTIVVGFLTMWVKLKYSDQKRDEKVDEVKDKIDANTEITKKGAKEAATNAKAAAETATEAKHAVQQVASKLNGGVDVTIEAAVKPLRDALQDHIMAFQEHAANDAKNMVEIRDSLKELHRQKKAQEV